MNPIRPTVGRIVLVTFAIASAGIEVGREYPAIIQRVWSDTCINAAVFLDSGVSIVTSIQHEDAVQGSSYTWKWRPYQLGQAAKTEELKTQLGVADEKTSGLTFSSALSCLKSGERVARVGWNGKGQWLRLVNPYVDPHFKVTEAPDAEGTLLPYVAIKTVDNGFVPWLASQTDMLAEDWLIVG